jgi:hypothetical protein
MIEMSVLGLFSCKLVYKFGHGVQIYMYATTCKGPVRKDVRMTIIVFYYYATGFTVFCQPDNSYLCLRLNKSRDFLGFSSFFLFAKNAMLVSCNVEK